MKSLTLLSAVIALTFSATTSVSAESNSRSLQTATTCMASLKSLESDIGLDAINDISYKWSIRNAGSDIWMANDAMSPSSNSLVCSAYDTPATQCGLASMCIVNDETQQLVRKDDFAPACRPSACASDSDYASALFVRVKTYGPRALFWYPGESAATDPQEAMRAQCDAGVIQCSYVFRYCGVTIRVPYTSENVQEMDYHEQELLIAEETPTTLPTTATPTAVATEVPTSENAGDETPVEENINVADGAVDAVTDEEADEIEQALIDGTGDEEAVLDGGNAEDSTTNDNTEMENIDDDSSSSFPGGLSTVLVIAIAAGVVVAVVGGVFLLQRKKNADGTNGEGGGLNMSFFQQYE